MAEGRQLEPSQEITSGAIIQARDPKSSQSFNTPVSCPNLKFNTTMGWTIVNGANVGGRLSENTSFEYGSDLTVEANWLMKVNTIIYCFGENAESVLRENVTVTGGGDPNPEPSTAYQFCIPTSNVNFQIIGANAQTKTIIKNNQVYKFIGWSSEEPTLLSSVSLGEFVWDSFNLSYPYQLSLSDFPSNTGSISTMYLKEEWASFVKYTTLNIIVTTNQHSVPGFENDYLTFRFSIPSLYTSGTYQYMSNPPDGVNNPAIVLSGEQLGKSITVENLTQTYGVYEFGGWYYGEYNDPDTPPSSYINEQNATISDYILAVANSGYNNLILTACFFRSGSTFTITYYTGLPNA